MISPGRGGVPPPTRPAGLTVWCGARNGRPPPRVASRPVTPAIRATSSASATASGGRIEGSRLAASDLPAPGGPIISRLWPPAAATSSACRRCGWPRRSARSGAPAGGSRRRSSGSGGSGRHSPATSAGSSARLCSVSTSRPRASAASGPFSDGQHDPLRPFLAGRLGDRQRPVDPAGAAVERQLAGQRQPSQALPDQLLGGAEQRRRDRQVHPRPRLAQAGRRQVDDDPLQRELEAAVDQRRPHPLARLAHGGVGEADDREAGQAAVDVDLDPDRAGDDAVEGEGSGGGEHAPDAREEMRTRGIPRCQLSGRGGERFIRPAT